MGVLPPLEKELEFSEEETNRLADLLDSAPGPTPWEAKYYPEMLGPRGANLKWKVNGPLTTLGPEGGPTLLALGLHCYVKSYSSNRIAEWHVRWRGGAPEVLEISLVDTEKLRPISDDQLDKGPPEYPQDKYGPTEGLVVAEGVLASLEIPVSLPRGTNHFLFPPEAKSVGELLLLLNSTSESMKGNMGRRLPRAIYVVDPASDQIEVVRLDWWNDADHDFGYEWISKLVRDPLTKNVVGAGVRIAPFILDARSYEHRGDWSRSRYKTFIYTNPDGVERIGLMKEIDKWIEEDSIKFGGSFLKKGYSVRPLGTPPLKWPPLTGPDKTG